MQEKLKLILKPGKESSLLRYHPWVFSGALETVPESVPEGGIVDVYTKKGECLGTGYYHSGGSISVRMLSFTDTEINQDFWDEAIANAFALRQRLGLTDNNETNAYRLVHGEGDGLPGLIIDYYAGTAVIQAHTGGIYALRELITKALQKVLGDKLKAVYDKSAETLHGNVEGAANGYLFGEESGTEIIEHGNRFKVDWQGGQKTGFFIDQRENRLLLGEYSKDQVVLNTFSYTGGFSVYALTNGAKQIDSVDISKPAIALLDENMLLNADNAKGVHASYAEDVFAFLKAREEVYDVIVLDPPAFAKSIKARHNAITGYKRLNLEAFKQIKPGGILFTFSCSQVVDKQMFYQTVFSAAIEAGRDIKVLHRLSQPPDHPVSIYHPEGEYLKGLVLWVG